MTSYIIVIKYIDNIRMAKIMDDFGYIEGGVSIHYLEHKLDKK